MIHIEVILPGAFDSNHTSYSVGSKICCKSGSKFRSGDTNLIRIQANCEGDHPFHTLSKSCKKNSGYDLFLYITEKL
jgi:hypothetical protein